MQTPVSKDVIYFKLPVFITDMLIHLSVLFVLTNYLPIGELTGFVSVIGEGETMKEGLSVLLALSYFSSVSVYGIRLHERRISILYVIWCAIVQTAVTYLLFTVAVAMDYKNVPRQLLAWGFIFSTVLIVSSHFLINRFVCYLRQSGRNALRVVFVGANESAQRAYEELAFVDTMSGYKVEGFFTSADDVAIPQDARNLGKVDDFCKWAEANHPDEVFCALPPDKYQDDVNRIIKLCNDKFIEFYFVPTFTGYPKRRMQVTLLGRVNIMKLREEPLSFPIAKFEKRAFDLLVSGLFLCTFYPLVLLFVWIGNKLTGNVGPLYFKQSRTGYNGKPFIIYKFRSMKVNAGADKLQATEHDPRKTPFGDFLRRSSIDELPQFINVFKGDMSIIGPRPHMLYHTELFSALISDYMVRHLVKPGITGWAQVSGCRGETRTVEEMADRVEHDIWYIEHWSPRLDMEIFFRTIWQVIPGHDKQAY